MGLIEKYGLQSHAPWWVRPELILEDSKLREFDQQTIQWRPEIFTKRELQSDAVFTLRGPRQVGKTTYLKLLIRDLLLETKHPKEAVFYFACDRIADFNELYDLLISYLEYIRPRTTQRVFIFLDEISFVKEWQRAIKQLADQGHLSGTTVVLTGSNTLDLKYSSERLPGRRGDVPAVDKQLLPIDFKEYVRLISPELSPLSPIELSTLHLPKLNKLFEDYLLSGGFMANVNELYQKQYLSAIRFEVYGSWIEGDLHKVGKSDKVLMRLTERLEEHLTSTTSFYKLAKETGVASYSTIEDYIDILEKMFVALRLDCFDMGQRKVDYKKNHKFYFSDPFARTALLAKALGFVEDPFNFVRKNFFSKETSAVWAEMLIVILFSRLYPQVYYGRIREQEVDLVARKEGIYTFCEVKCQTTVRVEDFKWMSDLLKKEEKLLVITKRNFESSGEIRLIPLEVFLLKYDEFLCEA
jgi:predicted AAA+ superfamily ATPase